MSDETVSVWDPAVRLFHWGLVASFVVAWLTSEDGEALHQRAGYAAGALIAARVLWGLSGSSYARFAQFLRSPSVIAGFLSAMAVGREPRYLGHNPAGGVMIVVLLLTVGGVAVTGWMYTLDAFWGVEWVEDTHKLLANLLLAMVVAHIAGVLLACFRHRENLVYAMIVGRKRAPAPMDVA